MALGGFPITHLPPEEFPPSSASPEELELYPGLNQLLQNLGGILGEKGLSPPLQKELQQAERSLGRARGLWLRLELLWRLLGELIRDPQDLEPQVVSAVEQELTWAQVRRGPAQLSCLLPPLQPPRPLPSLLPALGLRLRDKRLRLLQFLIGHPENAPEPQNPRAALPLARKPANLPQNPPGLVQNPPGAGPGAGPGPKAELNPGAGLEAGLGPGAGLGAELGAERRRLLRERLRERRLRAELERIGWRYGQVLGRCLSHLRRGHALRALQAHLDEGRGQYLTAKGGAMLLKSRLEELRVLLDTYPAPTVEAHRRIRAGLSERRRAAEAEAAILGAELAALRGLGPDFRRLALELGQIRHESAQKRWALRQLRPSPH